MVQLLKDKRAMMTITTCVAVFALAQVLALLAYATLSYQTLFATGTTTSEDFETGLFWLEFVAALGLLVISASKGWESFLKKDWKTTGELAGVVISFLLITIGYLIEAINVATNAATNYSVAVAVGIGLFGLLLLYKAGEASLAEQSNPQLPKDARLWLMSSVATIAIAVGQGVLTTLSSSESIASGIISAIGFGLLVYVVSFSYKAGRFTSIMTRQVVRGTAVFCAWGIFTAIVQGWEYSSSHGTVTGLRVVGSLSNFILALGFGFLTYACWGVLSGVGGYRGPMPFTTTPELPIAEDQGDKEV